ncbi:MAG TPA: hypothetical protein VMU39_18305 [Solirubrobacteraceae bacterium]|nr:hypothetical protein [Solirubrobacteraceae bacterium]
MAPAGCGLAEQSPDLFLLKRTGQSRTLTLLIKDDGTVRCDGKAAKPLSDPQLLAARDLESTLDSDAKKRMRLVPATGSVYSYTVTLPDGTLSFPDTSGAAHKEFAQTELFTAQVAESLCPSAAGA